MTNIAPQDAVLIGTGAATVGLLYTARRARTLSRKQHTVNAMLQANLNVQFRDNQRMVAEALALGPCPDLRLNEHEQLRAAFQFVANHFEFLAAGLRNGDFDEVMVRDSHRGSIVNLFEKSQDFIYKLRDARSRQTLYEHLEWLHRRWQVKPPSHVQLFFEWCVGHPFGGRRANPH